MSIIYIKKCFKNSSNSDNNFIFLRKFFFPNMYLTSGIRVNTIFGFLIFDLIKNSDFQVLINSILYLTI